MEDVSCSSCLFSDTERRSQPLPYYQEPLLTPQSCSHRIRGSCGIQHQRAEWGSASPQIPHPQDMLPFLPSLSLRPVKLSSSEGEYLAHSVCIQGVSDARCLLSHQLATMKTPRAALHPPNLGREGSAMFEFQKYG